MCQAPELTERYRKDAGDEAFLEHFNTLLRPFQEKEYGDLVDAPPTIHVVGAPRCGTTLLTQLLAAHLDVGHINNLIARFWRAPVYGIRLSRILLLEKGPSNYESSFGRTSNIDEPHEFGYFWHELLGCREMILQPPEDEDRIDWNRVRKLLNNIADAFGKPVLFKSASVLTHMFRLQQILPRTIFVCVRRDPTFNALSILKYRRAFYGSADQWVSYKPPEYAWLKDEPVWTQVAGQVFFLERAMDAQIERLGGRNVVKTTYEDLCREPLDVLRRVRGALRANDWETEFVSQPPESLQPKTRYDDAEYELVRNAVRQFYRD